MNCFPPGRYETEKEAPLVVQDTVRDYETLEKRLAEAERRLVDARAHVRRQKELIESLERDGLSVAAEFTTLKNLQMLVRLRLENRDQLMRELHKPS